jgi:hypothetical protein
LITGQYSAAASNLKQAEQLKSSTDPATVTAATAAAGQAATDATKAEQEANELVELVAKAKAGAYTRPLLSST